ncbi:MAG: serine/threonine protein kinase [Deltaproteobacteria bacterium]|nr:serine/threonine protein kinase [Deltaproteobacteria bacterium]
MQGLANVGDVLAGKYRVDKILGIGGMGMVVAATHLEIDQQVAIKFMLPSALESPEASARFMREARAVGRLTSEHVCRVSDVGKFTSGAPYIVMEYLEGLDLGTMLKRRGPLAVPQAVDYIMQACEGMAEAHAFGIVHRDLKPDNLFLAARVDGAQIVKVLDFGISKAAVTGIETRTGDVMGSPAYMAPEQMQSTKDVDARADIWSLGVVLYQLISGRMPFLADTLPALCLSVINDAPPPLSAVRKDLPPGLAEVVMRCLAKRKDERFPNVGELAKALAPFAPSESVHSITRINAMLHRKRQPTPPPLMMLPSEFADVVAPTMVGTSDSLDIVATPLPGGAAHGDKRAVTTVGSSSGESVAGMPKRGLPVGLLGAIAGTVALIALIVVMAMMKNGASAEPRPAAPPAAEDKAPPPPATAETPRPKVEPIDEPIPAPPPPVDDQAKRAATAEDVKGKDAPKAFVAQDPPKANAKARGKGKDKVGAPADKDKVGAPAGSAASGTQAVKGAVTDGGNDDGDAKWGHMHHDQPPRLLAPAGSGSGS